MLYLLKHSGNDLSNPGRELSQYMDEAIMGTYQHILSFHVIKLVLDTSTLHKDQNMMTNTQRRHVCMAYTSIQENVEHGLVPSLS